MVISGVRVRFLSVHAKTKYTSGTPGIITMLLLCILIVILGLIFFTGVYAVLVIALVI